MKSLKKIFALVLVLTLLVGMLGSCELLSILPATEVTISGGEMITMDRGELLQLEVEADGRLYGDAEWSSTNANIPVSDSGSVSADRPGETVITVTYGDLSDTIVIIVTTGDDDDGDGGTEDDGDGEIIIPADKYKNMTAEEFYSDYKPAVSYADALLRSAEGFMSGDITVPDDKPGVPDYIPMDGGKYVRNSSTYFGDGGNSYTVVDGYGNEVLTVYRGGGYITLEEVAAYVYAFGDIPANYDTNKKATTVSNSEKSEWGRYLRLNNSRFSGSTTKYPYEPELPGISGCGGPLEYYEIDIGTTGTDTGTNHSVSIYNNGTRITRGAARIVYVRFNSGRAVTDPNERYVFYTYNHYNDFQEYLNYYEGWGEMFGNITGGGTLSSKYDYNPTPYVETARYEFDSVLVYSVIIPYYKEEDLYA